MRRLDTTASRSLIARGGLAAALMALVCWSAGCNGDADTTDPAETPAPGGAADHAHDHDHDHGDHDHAEMDGDVQAALAELPPEDRLVAEEQKVCALSGEPLGSMGPPIKVEYEGKPVFLCCKGCTAAFEADPEKYVANLPNWQDDAATPEESDSDSPAEDPAPSAEDESTES